MSLVTPVGLDDGHNRLVRRTLVGALVITALTTMAMVIALIVFRDHGALVVKAYFTALALLLSLRLINVVLRAASGGGHAVEFRRRQNGARSLPNWPPDLFEMLDRVALAKVSEFDYEMRLQSLLRDVATQRLAARWNVDLSRQPAQARRLLGDQLWNAVGGGRAAAGRRDVRGPSLGRLTGLIEELERI